MDSQRRNLLILIALLGIWGLFLAFRPPWRPPARAEVRAAPVTPPRVPAAQGGGLPRLKKELLVLHRPAYPPEVRSFFGSPPPPPRPAQVAVTPPPAPAPPPPDPFQEEAKRLRYVGYLQA